MAVTVQKLNNLSLMCDQFVIFCWVPFGALFPLALNLGLYFLWHFIWAVVPVTLHLGLYFPCVFIWGCSSLAPSFGAVVPFQALQCDFLRLVTITLRY